MEENLKTLLTNPFDGKGDFQAECEEIAKKLFSHYCINCNGKEYYFAEIEFYYRNEEIDKWNNDWNKVTYSNRDGYEASSLFYHLSGVDICFECTAKRYGGILIRSVVEKKGNEDIITVGPLTCVNKMLNDCKGNKMPSIEKTEARNIEVRPTYRYLGKDDFKKIESSNNKDGHLMLAFFDNKLEESKWNKARSSYYKNRLIKYIDKK